MFSDISDASEFCESKRVNGLAKWGPKKNNRLTVRPGLIQIRFVVGRIISHNGIGKVAFPLPYKAAKNGKTAKNGIFPC